MNFTKLGFAALAALSLGGTAEAAFVNVGTNTENRILTDTRWTRDNVYILSRCIIVANGAKLTIEPGTIVRAVTSNMSGLASEPGALIVARGGKIVANGTADDPIIFTSIDDVNVPGGINTVPTIFNAVGINPVAITQPTTRATTGATSGTFTVAAASLRPALGDTITFSTVVGGLVAGTTYTVRAVPSATTFQLQNADNSGVRTLSAAGTLRIDNINGALNEAVNADRLSAPFALSNGAAYKVQATSLPGGLLAATTYYVINTMPVFAGASIFQLSATVGGAAVDITSVGTTVSLLPDASSFAVTGAGRDSSLDANNYSATGAAGDNGFAKSNLWGGVIICGNAYVGAAPSGGTAGVSNPLGADTDDLPEWTAVTDATGQNNGIGTDYVEGLSTSSGSSLLNPTLAIYGGVNDADNSGVIRFCSMRYGGFVVGAAATGNEINGLTVCGAGTGTTLEFIEIYQNRDDGFEWFGGKHDTRFLFSIANQDDLFDADEGFRGTHQFWLGVQGSISLSSNNVKRSGFASNNTFVGQLETASDYQYDKLLEIDGPEAADTDRVPRTNMTIMNATLLAGNTLKRGIQPRDEAILSLHNTVIEGASQVNWQELGAEGNYYLTELRLSNIHSNNPASTLATWLSTAYANSYNGLTTAFPLTATGSGSFAATSSLILTSGSLSTVFTDHGTTASSSQVASNWNEAAHLTGGSATSDLYTFRGFDPRTTGTSAATEDGGFVTPSGFVDADYAGMSLNNNFLAGWSTLEWLTVLPTTNTTRPNLTIGAVGSNPSVSFATAGATVKYVIEKSTDGKNWTVLTATPVTGASSISYTDTTTTMSAGTSVMYRAYAL